MSSEDWSEYHRRKKSLLVASAFCILLTILLLMFKDDWATGIFFVYLFLVVVPLAGRHVVAPCGHCGGRVHFKRYPIPLGSKCLQCGIPVPDRPSVE